MSKSIQEQMKSIADIMSKDDNGKKIKPKSYCIKGKTFIIKDDLKAWGWNFNFSKKHWELLDVLEDDPSLRIVQGIEDTWIEEL